MPLKTGKLSLALRRSLLLSVMMLADEVYTSALTPLFWHASITAAVPPTFTFLNSSLATAPPAWGAGDAVWMTTSGLISSKSDSMRAASVMSASR